MCTLFIDTNILKNNIEITKKLAGDSTVIGVVKGNGYGLGLCAFARMLTSCGIETLATNNLADAVALRKSGIHCDILLLSPLYNKEDIKTALNHYLILCISSYECGRMAEQAATEENLYARAHICIDTGLGRHGFPHTHTKDILYTIHSMEHICVTGIFSHFYASGGRNAHHTSEQLRYFTTLCDALEQENIVIGFRHIAASCALLKHPETCLDAVRIGSAFLGRLPFPDQWGYKPVGALEAPIEDIRTVPTGAGIGYGHAFIATRRTTVGIVPAGYADGLSVNRSSQCPGITHFPGFLYRFLKNNLIPRNLYATHAKEQFPVLGKIGMNSVAIDITGSDLKIGDTVSLPVNPIYVDSSIPRRYGIPSDNEQTAITGAQSLILS